MKELSIFIDESGDFGAYQHHSPYYIVAMVFHEQNHSIEDALRSLENELENMGLSNHCIHSGPIIRGEEEYRYMSLLQRRKIFNKMIAFIRKTEMKYHCFHIEKKHMESTRKQVGCGLICVAFLAYAGMECYNK